MNKCLKTMVISILLTIAMPMAKLSAQVSVWDGTNEPWTHGTGTEADPFLIENAQQLAYLAYRVNNGLDANGGHVSNHNLHYKLMVDVDLTGNAWPLIGYWNSDTDCQCFGGYFDGNNHTISGIIISSSDRVGFFGYTGGASVVALGLNGYTQSSNGRYVGGIIGVANNTTIIDCYNTGRVLSSHYAGGIVGSCGGTFVTITNCYNTGEVVATYGYAGGILGGVEGNNNVSITITNCYNIGSMTTSDGNAGGIIGYSSVNNCYTMNCYYLSSCGGNNTYGGQPIWADAMQTQEFVETLNNCFCAWKYDYSNTNSGYPVLTGLFYQATTELANTFVESATLHGSVFAKNTSIISKGFEYRKLGDLNYTSIGITDNSDSFSYYLTGLAANTIYEYRTFLNVADCDNTAYGETKRLFLFNNDTICIYNADMLRWVSEQCNCGTTFEGYCIKLMNDIVLPENVPNNMTSIGVYPDYPFMGTFDGNGKLITNLYIDHPNTEYQGFFGYTLNANLYNVGLVNITASGRNYTGGMVAYAKNTYLRDCYVNGGTLFALSYCGGLVGYQEQGTNSIISGSYNTCEVSGNNYVGGLVGFSNYSTVRNSYVAAMVAAQGDAVGSIIGGANEVLMYYCYFNSELTGQTNAIGWNNIGGGKDGGEAMTSAQMRDPQFVATLNQGLTVHVWKRDYSLHINNGFPILQWQQGTGVNENEVLPVAVYPNPTNGNITIEAEDLKQITISNMLGQVVYESKVSGDTFEYDFSVHEAGVYLVRIETASGVAVKKVSVAR